VQPAPITATISDIVERIMSQPNASLATLSILIALFTASGGMSMTMAGLDTCYDVRPEKMRPLYRSRPVAMLLTVIVAAMVLGSVVLIPVADALLQLAARQGIGGYRIVGFLWLINPLRYILGVLLLLGVLALVYRWGPSLRTRMHLMSPGSVFCVIMWLLTAWAFRVYLGYFGAAENYEKTYGAVAGVAVLMLLFYLDAFFLLLGAEINSEIDFIKLGIRSGPLPEEQEIAPVPTYQLDEEDRELKAEIEERRSVDAVPAEPGRLEGEGAGI
jgi:membrane protein